MPHRAFDSLDWVPLHPNYLKMKRLMICIVWPLWFLAVGVAVWLMTPGLVWVGLVALVAACWIPYPLWRQGRVYRAWGYCETDTDLYVRNGLLWRHVTVVPYGRMQLVEMNSGPIDRRYGLASVSMVTASASSDASIPGLATSDATALRDRLAAAGEVQQVGL